ncbi:MAG TPA: helix-turn-helix transcriptional regulator [Ferruginibacter sp.]|nr:hypothetical protein [Chitinophagaceae bacterium]HRI23546.1 helix-turn-helix transcriptional regulator [Ferruginibacter sp.]
MLTIGLRIKKLREIRGYSQNYMSVKLKMSQEQYSYLENRQKNIAEEQIQVIATVLGISVDRLKSFDPERLLTEDDNPITGGYISRIVIRSHENEIEAYKELIKTLKTEIELLRRKNG